MSIKLFKHAKDGGPESNVEGYWLIEWKNVFSIALLKFNKGHRDAFHSHAFNAWSWFIKGAATEQTLDINTGLIDCKEFCGMCFPKYTPRSQFHRYIAVEKTWCLTFRGPWSKYWKEATVSKRAVKMTTLTHGRKVVGEKDQ